MDPSLHIRGYEGQSVPNELLHQEGGSRRLAIILPGMGYTSAMPLLYYSGKACLDRGYDVLLVNYEYRNVSESIDTPEFRVRMQSDVEAALDTACADNAYDSVLLAGKSLGTLAMAGILATSRWPIIAGAWLTPLLRDPSLVAALEGLGPHAFAAIGDADHHYDAGTIANLREAGVDVVVVDGADHSIDIPGDIGASVDAVGQVIARGLAAFLDRIADTLPRSAPPSS